MTGARVLIGPAFRCVATVASEAGDAMEEHDVMGT